LNLLERAPISGLRETIGGGTGVSFSFCLNSRLIEYPESNKVVDVLGRR
jgi:hypothetical protein